MPKRPFVRIAIAGLLDEGGPVPRAEMRNMLNHSKGAIHQACDRMAALGLIEITDDGSCSLTQDGREWVRRWADPDIPYTPGPNPLLDNRIAAHKLLDRAPHTADELPAWLRSLDNDELGAALSPVLVEALVEESLSPIILTQCMAVVRERLMTRKEFQHV